MLDTHNVLEDLSLGSASPRTPSSRWMEDSCLNHLSYSLSVKAKGRRYSHWESYAAHPRPNNPACRFSMRLVKGSLVDVSLWIRHGFRSQLVLGSGVVYWLDDRRFQNDQ